MATIGYIIGGILFFIGIFLLLRQYFSAKSPATVKDMALTALSMSLTFIGTLIAIVAFIGDKQELLIKQQELLIKQQEVLVDGQKELSTHHTNIIKILEERLK